MSIVILAGNLIIAVLCFQSDEKVVKMITGFNTFSEEEQNKYDKKKIAKDFRNKSFILTGIIAICTGLSFVMSVFSLVVMIIFFLSFYIMPPFISIEKAFSKYKIKSEEI
jgi:hypothetical protein